MEKATDSATTLLVLFSDLMVNFIFRAEKHKIMQNRESA